MQHKQEIRNHFESFILGLKWAILIITFQDYHEALEEAEYTRLSKKFLERIDVLLKPSAIGEAPMNSWKSQNIVLIIYGLLMYVSLQQSSYFELSTTDRIQLLDHKIKIVTISTLHRNRKWKTI